MKPNLTPTKIEAGVQPGLAGLAVDGRRGRVGLPDGTRTMPMPLMASLFSAALGPHAGERLYRLATPPIIKASP